MEGRNKPHEAEIQRFQHDFRPENPRRSWLPGAFHSSLPGIEYPDPLFSIKILDVVVSC